jgi:hypothetical protein
LGGERRRVMKYVEVGVLADPDRLRTLLLGTNKRSAELSSNGLFIKRLEEYHGSLKVVERINIIRGLLRPWLMSYSYNNRRRT